MMLSDQVNIGVKLLVYKHATRIDVSKLPNKLKVTCGRGQKGAKGRL